MYVNVFCIQVCDGLWVPSKIHCVVKYSYVIYCTYCKHTAYYCTDSWVLLIQAPYY